MRGHDHLLVVGAAGLLHRGDRFAEPSHRLLDQRSEDVLAFRGNPSGQQYPAPPAVQAHEQPALAPVTGRIQVQRVAAAHGGAQLGDAKPVEGLQAT